MRNIFLTVLVIVCSCSKKELPQDLVPQEKMVEVLMEVHLLEAKLNSISITPMDSTQALYEQLEKELFSNLEVDREQYEKSMSYYIDHPNEFEQIYTAVVDSLMEREKKLK